MKVVVGGVAVVSAPLPAPEAVVSVDGVPEASLL